MTSRLVACLLVILVWAPAMGQDVRVPSSAGEIRLSYAPVVKRVAPAVVNVYAARVVENRFPMFDDPIFRRFFGGGSPREQVQRSLGSGVIVDPAGLVVTNFHVIENADQIKVSLADKREFEADIVLKDQRSDLGGGPSGPREQVQRSLGSGVIVDPSGLVVTNFHVIENADQVRISLADKREFEADIVLKDQRSDRKSTRLNSSH